MAAQSGSHCGCRAGGPACVGRAVLHGHDLCKPETDSPVAYTTYAPVLLAVRPLFGKPVLALASRCWAYRHGAFYRYFAFIADRSGRRQDRMDRKFTARPGTADPVR